MMRKHNSRGSHLQLATGEPPVAAKACYATAKAGHVCQSLASSAHA